MVIDLLAITRWTADQERAQDAYAADEAVRAGVCATCREHPIYNRARTCVWCRKERP